MGGFIMNMTNGSKARSEFREFVEEHLDFVVATSITPRKQALGKLLRQAEDALAALDYGEVQSIFAPAGKKGSKDGTKPYTLRKLRMMALGFIDLLKTKGYLEKTARRMVAAAHGESPEVVKKWKQSKMLGKTHDTRMQLFRQKIKKSNWEKDRVLKELNETGEHFKLEKKLAHK